MPLVFVYGTLMRAGANHAVLARLGCSFVARARTLEPRVLVDLGPYPALLPARHERSPAPTTCVEGELWAIEETALHALDAFEGCPELYRRDRIALVTADGEEVEAFVYALARRPPAHARVIATGRYAAPGSPLPNGAQPGQIEPDEHERRGSGAR